uniref:Fucolectin tachylectin-4 pentraxin-1 domain-containing protein n=1 Tax=Gadus morhua TaxID=8049 RepID=A0A8C5AL31_GADMO
MSSRSQVSLESLFHLYLGCLTPHCRRLFSNHRTPCHVFIILLFILYFVMHQVSSSTSASSIDVPLRGAAIQSSAFPGGGAGWAIDGSCSPFWEQSCAHTKQQDNPWWRLQLDGVYRVSVIEVTNRNVFMERLDGVEIHIGDSLVNNGNDNPRCAIIHNVPDSLTQSVQCWGMEGMYVNFYKPFPFTYLTLCEVKVYGGRHSVFHFMSSLVLKKGLLPYVQLRAKPTVHRWSLGVVLPN